MVYTKTVATSLEFEFEMLGRKGDCSYSLKKQIVKSLKFT